MTKLSKSLIIYNLILLVVVAMMTAIILVHVLESSKSLSNIETSLQEFELVR